MPANSAWLLYGANGYTGRLIAQRAASNGRRPILAGRTAATVQPLAESLGLEWRAFSLDDPQLVAEKLADAALVLNCAGPFVETAGPMLEACLTAKVHYLDITGEIDVIERAHSLSERAREAEVTVIPAVGFDVVPTDCLAAMLAHELPSATQLELAFSGSGSLSPGTAKTLIRSLPDGGRVREDGRIKRVPIAWKTREIPFRNGLRPAMTIPWGDVSSAYYSTGIPNIRVYIESSPRRVRRLRRVRWLAPLLRLPPLRKVAERRVDKRIEGPQARERERRRASIWGEARDREGKKVSATMLTPNGYELTVQTSLVAVQRVLAGGIPIGFQTPSLAFGRDFILSFEGVDYLLNDTRFN